MDKKTNNIQSFLDKLSIIDYKYRTLEEAEEQFNIFTALYKENDEVRLHSRFISVLLSPIGKHKRGETFLKLFLQTLQIEHFELEHYEVYPNEKDKQEYRNIDLLIINKKHKSAIIIENKIDARDSNNEESGQLERYFDLIVSVNHIPKNNIVTVYLTKDRHEPSDESLGKYNSLEEINGFCIDYEHEIQDWINLCIKECVDKPYLRESLSQYLKLIKRMTHNSNIQERLDIKELIASSSSSMQSAKLLFENFKHVKWHTVREFWDELADQLEIQGYKIIQKPSNKDIEDTTHFETYKKGYTNNCDFGIRFEVTNGLILYIWNGSGNEQIFWGGDKGIKFISKDYQEKIKNYISNKDDSYFKESKGSLFWKYFDLESTEEIIFANFMNDGTFNLINDNNRKKAISKLVAEITSFCKKITK